MSRLFQNKTKKAPQQGGGKPADGSHLTPQALPESREPVTVEPVDATEKVRLAFPYERPILSKASFFVKLALLIIALVLLTVSGKLAMDYTGMLEEEANKREQYARMQDRIDELNYYISSPMDEYYVRKFAWEIFHMVPSDQKVIIVPEN